MNICHREKLIGLDMSSGEDKSVFLSINRAKHFTEKSRAILDRNDEVVVSSMVCSITTLAVLNADVLHIHVSYSAHVNQLFVRANPADADYSLLDKKPVLKSWQVYLDKPDALAELKALEDELIEFVADAKDCLMGAV